MLASLARRSGARAYQLGGASLWSGHAAVASQWQPTTAQGRGLTRTHVTIEDGPGTGAPRVVILGGGFGGLYTAVRLMSLFWPKGKKPQVTLVDQSERFVFKPLLYELLNGGASEQEVAPSYTQLLEPYPVRFIQSKVVGAEPEQLLRDGGSAAGGKIKLAGGAELDYDWLVVALGAQADSRGVPGVAERAVPFNTLEDALKARDALAAIEQRGSGEIVIVGAGYAGVELACVIGERLRDKGLSNTVQVRLVTPGKTVLESSALGQRQASEQMLAKLGVKVVTGTRVRSITAPTFPEVALPTAATINLDDRPPMSDQLRTVAANMADTAADFAADFAVAANGAAVTMRDTSTGELAGIHKATSEDLDRGAVRTERPSPAVAAAAVEAAAEKAAAEKAAADGYVGPISVNADLVLWTAGSSPVTKAARKGFPFPTNDRGSVQTDATLRVLSHSRVFALGDVCVADKAYVQDPAGPGSHDPASGTSFPATAQVAFQQADYVAWNVWAGMMGRPLLPFRYQHLGSMMSLGSFSAAVDLPVPVPSVIENAVQASPLGPLLETLGVKLTPAAEPGAAGGVTLEGPLGALLRRAAYLYRQPTGEQRLSVAAEWVSQASGIASAALANLQQQQQQRTR